MKQHETTGTTAATPARVATDDPTAAAAASLDIAGLEQVYDTLAQAIDEAGPERSELFLVKLALLNAQALGSAERFGEHVRAALRDLEGQPRG